MSGGSYNYVYRQIEDIEINCNTPQRKAFADHLKKVAKAMHDIEWVDSMDYGEGDETDAIKQCLSQGAVLGKLISQLQEISKEIAAEISNIPDDERIFHAASLLRECLPHITGGPEYNYLNNRISEFIDRLESYYVKDLDHDKAHAIATVPGKPDPHTTNHQSEGANAGKESLVKRGKGKKKTGNL